MLLTQICIMMHDDPHVGMFYYMIGNIDPRLRSGLNTIQLMAVARTQHIDKYGMNEILKPFMEEIRQLEEVIYYKRLP